MSDIYGALPIPVPPLGDSGEFPPESAVGDPLLGYVGDFLRTILRTYVGDAWTSIAPGIPIVKSLFIGDPEDMFIESALPAIYIYRPGKETRETLEVFEQVADDYRFEKGRIAVWWIMPAAPQERRRERDEILNAMRKVIDRCIHVGRDPAWKVPGHDDTDSPNYDVKAATFGSSLSGFSGFATLELQHAGPATYLRRMEPPAKHRSYMGLRISIYVEELLNRDINLLSEANESLKAQYTSPDQETGLGDFVLGEDILTGD